MRIFSVAILLSDKLLATSASLPIEMLQTAEGAARAKDRRAPRIRVRAVSRDGQPAVSSSGFAFTADGSITDVDKCDLILIPGFWRNPRPVIAQHRDYLPWLVDQHQRGASIAAVGTGCCYLAAAGLLDDKPATTHWHYFDQFQRDYPLVNLKRQYFITRAGNLYCAASVNSLAELMVNLVYRWYGREVANLVQRNFFHEIRNSFEPSHYYSEESRRHPDEDILQAQIWMQDNFHRPVEISALATQFGMSTRNFNRRFKQALDQTPLQYLRALRLNAVKDLLQHTNLNLNEIAPLCGYQDVSFVGQLFKRQFGISPSHYRDTVRAKLFAPDQD